jgi:energy-coupling factor transport system ATP-binding protein
MRGCRGGVADIVLTSITLDQWRMRYPAQERWAIDGVDLTLRRGEITWLGGAIGAGTSTLLLGMAGLAPRLTGGDASGVVLHDGRTPADRSPLQDGIGYLGASPGLQISGIARTVRDEIAVGPMNLGRSVNAIRDATRSALERLHIEQLADRAPGELSGGETQRVMLACLLASEPSTWLLDEPFSALDRASVVHVRRLLQDLARLGATIAIACDDADTMLDVADRLVVLRHGRVALDGLPRPLLAGDAIDITAMGTTDAATVAAMARLPSPRPLTRPELVRYVRRQTVPAAQSVAAPARPAADAMELLRFDRVAFAYGHGPRVLQDASLTVAAGEAVGIFGDNGAGKSTLLRLAMALEHPVAGTVQTLGQPTSGLQPEDLAPIAGFLFQQPERQLFAASVQAECSWAPKLAGWDDSRVRHAVVDTLDALGLSDTSPEHPYDLPLPLRRLVALAAILAADPALILLDEPTAGLDAASRERVIRVIRSRAASGRGVVAITHDPLFAHEALDRGVVLDHGRVVADGPVREILDDRVLPRTAALVVAETLGLPAGHDRRADVVPYLRN